MCTYSGCGPLRMCTEGNALSATLKSSENHICICIVVSTGLGKLLVVGELCVMSVRKLVRRTAGNGL